MISRKGERLTSGALLLFILGIVIYKFLFVDVEVREIVSDPIVITVEAEIEKPLLFKPTTILTVVQEALCTKLAVYGETRNSSIEEAEYIMWVVINRAMDPRRDSQYKGTSCGVVRALGGLAFEGAKGYTVIDKIVWGERLDYVPKSARGKSTPNAIAWHEIGMMVDKAYEGLLVKKTNATHFLNLQSLDGPIKNWVKALKPVGVSSNHILFIDYEIIDGNRVMFTKENPYKVNYNWSNHVGKKKEEI